MKTTLADLCAHLGVPAPEGQGGKLLEGIKPLDAAGPEDLSFLENPSYRAQAKTTRAGAVLIKAADAALLPAGVVAVVCPQPYVAYARALQFMYPAPPLAAGVSSFAVVSGSAQIAPTARVEPYAVIYANAVVGEGAHIGAHAVIGDGVVIGAGTRVGPHATLLKCRIGNECLIHPGVRIGQDGFGFAQSGEELIKIPHLGQVVIGNRVEIGANSTIDAGALADTVLEDDVKLDKQVQIAHNVQLGRGVRVAAQSGVAGSTRIGAGTMIGGQSGVAGHISIAPRCMVAAASGVTKSIEAPGSVVAGVPAVPITQWRQQMAALALATQRGQKKVSSAPTVAPPSKGQAAVPQTPVAAAVPQAPVTPDGARLPTGSESANPFIGADFTPATASPNEPTE